MVLLRRHRKGVQVAGRQRGRRDEGTSKRKYQRNQNTKTRTWRQYVMPELNIVSGTSERREEVRSGWTSSVLGAACRQDHQADCQTFSLISQMFTELLLCRCIDLLYRDKRCMMIERGTIGSHAKRVVQAPNTEVKERNALQEMSKATTRMLHETCVN